MNTNGLAKQYGCLTPRERLPLILAASARGDEVERERLGRSAPRVGYRVPDHFGLAMAFREVCEQHFMELLNLAANYLQASAYSDAEEGAEGGRFFDLAGVLGYVYRMSLAGWRLFCEEHRLEPELYWSYLPGVDTIRRAEKMAAEAAFTEEAVARWGATQGGGKLVEVRTAQDVAADLRDCFQARADWWG
jgi:hypothetical protein